MFETGEFLPLCAVMQISWIC